MTKAMQRKSIDPPASIRRQLETKQEHRPSDAQLASTTQISRWSRNDILPTLTVVQCAVDQLKSPARRLRKSESSHVREIASAISTLGFNLPILIGGKNEVVDGNSRLEAARLLGLTHVPCIRLDHLDACDQRLLRIALNRLAEKGKWDFAELSSEFEELIVESAPVEITGFGIDEIDGIIIGEKDRFDEVGLLEPMLDTPPISRIGDVWLLGSHRLVCGDATDPNVLMSLMRGGLARLVFTAELFETAISGNVAGRNNCDPVAASGATSDEQFLKFSRRWLDAVLPHVVEGGLVGTFIDWRRLAAVHAAAASLDLVQIDLIVWTKTNAGVGDLYRSRHELLPLFKKGCASHVHNVFPGKRGRRRSNVWDYPCPPARESDVRRGSKERSTVRPTAMLEDALVELSSRAEIILEPFSGAGSILIACEKTGRICHAIELDPMYVDVTIRQFQTLTQNKVILEDTGRTFDDVERERRSAGP